MYSHVACDVMKERTFYLLKPSSLIWHLMPYLFLFTLNSVTTGVRELNGTSEISLVTHDAKGEMREIHSRET